MSSIKESLKIDEFISKETDKNLVYYLNDKHNYNYLYLFDINSDINNIPIFLKTAVTQVVHTTIKENLENLDKINVILLKDSMTSTPKNSVVLTLSIGKVNEEDRLYLNYLNKEKLAKTLKVFDLKSNFNPSM